MSGMAEQYTYVCPCCGHPLTISLRPCESGTLDERDTIDLSMDPSVLAEMLGIECGIERG